MNNAGVSIRNVYPRNVGDKTQGVPSLQKVRRNVPMSTHGSTPMPVQLIVWKDSSPKTIIEQDIKPYTLNHGA